MSIHGSERHEPLITSHAPHKDDRLWSRLLRAATSISRRRALGALIILVGLFVFTEAYLLSAPQISSSIRKLTSRPSSPTSVPAFSPTSVPTSLPTVPVLPSHSHFERALTRVFKLLPEEEERKKLLQPIKAEHEEKLHELAVRARRYAKLFEAWEELHVVVHDNNSNYIRDDIIQRMRRYSDSNELRSEYLSTYGLSRMVHSYETYRYFLTKLAGVLFPWTAPYFPDHMTLHSHIKQGGRGIVFTAGNKQAEYLLTSIPSLRSLGCMLPIEVMYLGESDLKVDFRERLEALDGVTTRDVAQMVETADWELAGWATKPFSILLSSFREALFIDADSFFFRNPEVLFDGPGYNETGALFFRDRRVYPSSRKEWLQKILPEPISETAKKSRFWTGETGHEQESGLLLVDKWRHFVTLLMVTRLNGPERYEKDGGAGIYEMVHGDKETFWLSWELVGDVDYSFHQGAVGGMGKVEVKEEEKKKDEDKKDEDEKDEDEKEKSKKDSDVEGGERSSDAKSDEKCTLCSAQLLHLDLDGMPLWVNGWILKNKNRDPKDWEYGKWEQYAPEPPSPQEIEWSLGGDNYCCLTAGCHTLTKSNFTEGEQASLTSLISKAKEVRLSLRG